MYLKCQVLRVSNLPLSDLVRQCRSEQQPGRFGVTAHRLSQAGAKADVVDARLAQVAAYFRRHTPRPRSRCRLLTRSPVRHGRTQRVRVISIVLSTIHRRRNRVAAQRGVIVGVRRYHSPGGPTWAARSVDVTHRRAPVRSVTGPAGGIRTRGRHDVRKPTCGQPNAPWRQASSVRRRAASPQATTPSFRAWLR